MSNHRISILLADDHALIRRGLAGLIEYEKDLSVVGEAADGQEAVDLSEKLKPDIVVMDLMMPVLNGAEATQCILSLPIEPKPHILILTTFGTSADIAKAIKAGATGAIMKDATPDMQLSAIRAVASGKTVFSPQIVQQLKEYPEPIHLTGKQLDILESITRGLTDKDVATQFGISVEAVRKHLDSIRQKLGAANRTEAVAIALRKHLLKI